MTIWVIEAAEFKMYELYKKNRGFRMGKPRFFSASFPFSMEEEKREFFLLLRFLGYIFRICKADFGKNRYY